MPKPIPATLVLDALSTLKVIATNSQSKAAEQGSPSSPVRQLIR